MPRGGQAIARSIGDGPHPEHTPPLVDLMQAHGVKATFFVICRLAKRRPDLVQRIDEEGHAIGIHSNTHPSMARLSARARIVDMYFDVTESVAQHTEGRHERLFGTQNGPASVTTNLNIVLRQRPLVPWTVDNKCCDPDSELLVVRLAQAALHRGDTYGVTTTKWPRARSRTGSCRTDSLGPSFAAL